MVKKRTDQNLPSDEWDYYGPNSIAKLGDLGEARNKDKTEVL